MGDDENTNPGRRSVMPAGIAHRVRALEDRVDELVAECGRLRAAVFIGLTVLVLNGIVMMWHR